MDVHDIPGSIAVLPRAIARVVAAELRTHPHVATLTRPRSTLALDWADAWRGVVVHDDGAAVTLDIGLVLVSGVAIEATTDEIRERVASRVSRTFRLDAHVMLALQGVQAP
jgi:uncharacterized alkaline shock family protein YloU